MVELALPGGLAVWTPLQPNARKHSPGAAAGPQTGVLFWVLIGHVVAARLVLEVAEPMPAYQEPQVIRVSWLNAVARVEQPPTPAAHPTPIPEPVLPRKVSPPAPARTAAPTPYEPAAPVAPASLPASVAPNLAQSSSTAISSSPGEPTNSGMTSPAGSSAAPAHMETGSGAVSAPATEAPATPPSFHADYLANLAPEYPPLSRRLGEQGTVCLRVRVSADGLPVETHLDSSSGHSLLDRAALEAVADWRFVPAKLGDRAVVGSVLVPIHFSLRETP